MTTYYVGPGGNNANAGTSWALRKLTLTGVEALALAAGDNVFVGAGTYRETLTTSHSGSAGNPITYTGDQGGTNTDGVGGEVRITGSDNDQTATRANCISCGNNFRTFVGLNVDTTTSMGFSITGNNVIINQCSAQGHNVTCIDLNGASCNTCTVQNSVLFGSGICVRYTHTATVSNTAHVLQNCLLFGANTAMVSITRIGGITIANCTAMFGNNGIRCTVSPAGGQVNNVNNCIVSYNTTGFSAIATTDITEDYNDLFLNGTARSNVNTGAHSQVYSPLHVMPLMSLTYHSWLYGALASYSPLASIAGTGVPATDMYGTTRAGTSSWGPIQYIAGQRFTDIGAKDRHGL